MRQRRLALRCATLLCGVAVAVGAATTPAVAGEAAPSWTFAPASAPPPPPGVAPASYPVPLGEVGDIEFWAPNRGVLITGGDQGSNPAVPAGVYAYDGASWHELASVCGGAKGRIVWAGPDEFWTISDERSFQLSAGVSGYTNLSLCHFLNGQVVGSYAEPFDQPSSYQEMDGGACLASDDCWFGGALGTPPNSGAFHLHWDGANVTVVYAPQDHAIASMAAAGNGTLLESVQLSETDEFGEERTDRPTLVHRVDGPGTLFANVFMSDPGCLGLGACPPLPDYGVDSLGRPVAPSTLGPLMLGSDFSLAQPGNGQVQLWAAAAPSPNPPSNLASSEGVAHTIVLRYSQGTWNQVVGGADPGGDEPFTAEETPQSITAEPGIPAAWVTIGSSDGQAHLDLLTAGGTISEHDVLGEAQGVGRRGEAGPIACPAPHECWLATRRGWLFRLSEGGRPAQDTDPNFAGVITYRPTDPSVPVLPPNEPPIDNSLANQLIAPPPPPTSTPRQLVNLPIALDLHSRLVARYTLELTFKLAAKAHVQLLASRKGHVVAKTRREILSKGKRTLDLRLDPRRWPTKVELKAKPLRPLLGPAPGSTSSGTSVGPAISAGKVGT